MKKLICWLTAAASLAALADDAAITYALLNWSVPAESIAAVDAKYVNLYATADGVRVGSEGRSTPGGGDVGVSAATVVLGDGGWDWSGKDVTQATFAVEFLNAELGVIATSAPATYGQLLEEGSLDLNLTGSGIPKNAVAVHAFEGTVVGEDGVYEYLKSVFDGLGAKVVPRTDAEGEVVDYLITLSRPVEGPVSLHNNLGKLTVDLKGFDIVGTNAVNGAEGAGGDAIMIAGSLEDSLRGTTELHFVNTAATGYGAEIAGGAGADNATGTAGGFAVSSDVPVTVVAGANVVLRGGRGGNSMTGDAVAGTAAVDGNVTATGATETGADGTQKHAWAWAKCTFSGELPAGTTQSGDTLYFWKRTDLITNLLGFATFDFDALAGQAVADGTVHFVDGPIDVDQLSLTSLAGSLTFAGGEDTVLVADVLKSVFRVDADAGQTVGWTNLTFTATERAMFCEDGAAISVDGGAVSIVGCCFTNCIAEHLGGAVCLTRLDGDSRIAETFFGTNGVPGANCYGGALYASATNKSEAVTLALADCTFTGNAAQRGGAVSTLTSQYDDEKPVALAVSDSTFADNEAVWGGGAIDAEGDLTVDLGATWEEEERGTTLFARNLSGYAGGAICFTGPTNEFGDVECGPVSVKLCRGVVFEDNVVSNAAYDVYGAAIDMEIPGSTFSAEGVAFLRNRATGAAEYGVYGGAYDTFLAKDTTNTFDTCVFDGNEAVPMQTLGDEYAWYYYGGAVCAVYGRTLLKNSTFRRQNIEAVTAASCELEIVNCVLVDNYTSVSDDGYDFYVGSAEAAVSYSAWGAYAADEYAKVDDGTCNLTNRTAAVYDGDTLYLNESGFNPVAALGLVQPGVYDFDGVEYGSKPAGFSMGAYECGSTPAEIYVSGTKTYDGSASSNGCTWAWASSVTNGDIAALGPVETLVTITNWVHGSKDAGHYVAPETLTAGVDGNTEEIRRWIAQGFLTFSYDGTIDRRPISEGGLEVVVDPDEYAWTGSNVVANVTVTDTLAGETLVADYDYALSFEGNVEPTASAKAYVDTLRNFEGLTNGTFAITAYFVEYRFDGVLREDLTKTVGRTSGVEVAISQPGDTPSYAGYAFDSQHSPTNGVVRRYDHDKGLLRLQVLYCTDSNADGVPDKYQRKVIAKIVNGQWTANAAADQVRWATLTDADGKWSATGTGTLDTAVPTPGSALNGFTGGGWLAFVNGTLTEVTPASVSVDTLSVPFLLYAYSRASASGGTTRPGGLGGKKPGTGGTSPSVPTKTLVEQYAASMSLADAKVVGGEYVLEAKLVVRDADNAGTTVNVPLDGARITVYMAETLGAEWTPETLTPAEDGKIHVPLTGRSGFYKVGL